MIRLITWLAVVPVVLVACSERAASPAGPMNAKVNVVFVGNCPDHPEPTKSRCLGEGIQAVCVLPDDSIKWQPKGAPNGADFKIEVSGAPICDNPNAKNCKVKHGLGVSATKYDIVGEGTSASCDRIDPYIIVLN